MSSHKDWKAYVEAHKFTGPTIKLLMIEPNYFAVLDHEYNLVGYSTSVELPYICNMNFVHPPQRERPKPIIYEYADERDAARMSIDTGDLDL